MRNFWLKIKKPIFCLAPMADVTDCAFRQIIAKYGQPDVFWTEFVSADGLCSMGKNKLLINLKYGENERPIMAQIFGSNPENIKKASTLCKKLKFDGLDINMGCPDKSVEKQRAGAALMKNPKLAREIIRAAKKGGGGLPISVKTRLGYRKNEMKTWISALLEENIAVLTVHLRTRQEMSDVPAHWNLMKKIVAIRDKMKVKTLIIGNGDVLSLEEARKKVEETGCDGVMLGRAIFGNPWLFCNLRSEHILKSTDIFLLKNSSCSRQSRSQVFLKYVPSLQEKLKVMVEHTKLFEKMLDRHKNFATMKKHYKAYANGFKGAKELRVKLMKAENATQMEEIVKKFIK